ncbi:hypothetical protein BJX61DRAFT_545833 [Aspergillus egyptiacus]|nr:hypothetical protein BJX61DRAFT_545833 [Aspergillus egyptiacus]
METADNKPSQTQSLLLDGSAIHFTPVKNSTAPRAWDRKPSTSFLARSKPRKVWKRFRSSFNSMKALQQLINPDGTGLKENELLLEINARRGTGELRGVKRQCLTAQTYSKRDEGVESAARGRSFLETKWESESRKQRKLPANTDMNDQMSVDSLPVEEDENMPETGSAPGGSTSTGDCAVLQALQCSDETRESPSLDSRAAYPDTLPGGLQNERGVVENVESGGSDPAEIGSNTTTSADATGNALDFTADSQLRPDGATVSTMTTSTEEESPIAAVPEQLTTEQESTLVRSALRSSLGGEDTELLNNFLSKAKAKREAKAAAEAEAATAPVIAQDPEEKDEALPEVAVEIPTPERRVLEALDANSSSSPQRSPCKSEKKDENNAEEKGIATSPVARRSTRVRSLPRAAAPSTFRPMLSLRRAKGTEFVFLQRTEAQELALLTRKNTRQNKGDALLPKQTLQGLTRRMPSDLTPADDNIRKPNKPRKYVSWNEERLVEFEGESSSSEDELVKDAKPAIPAPKTAERKRAASGRTVHSKPSATTGAREAAAATTAPPAAVRGRRVRRLGPPNLDPTTFDPPSSSPPPPTTAATTATASPIAKRKKLTPKSPKSALPKTPSKVPTVVVGERPSLLSGGRSVKTNLLKVNAGSTPMPRRVRRA